MVEYGKKIYPKKTGDRIERTETAVIGPHWSIRLIDGEYVYEYLSGGHAGGINRQIVTEEDFRRVHSGEMTDYDLLLKYDLS